MSRPSVNRSGEMEIFAKAVELADFRPAARHYRMTPSAVSKLVLRLEERLGVRLVNRSTRKLQLTPEDMHSTSAVRLLADIDKRSDLHRRREPCRPGPAERQTPAFAPRPDAAWCPSSGAHFPCRPASTSS